MPITRMHIQKVHQRESKTRQAPPLNTRWHSLAKIRGDWCPQDQNHYRWYCLFWMNWNSVFKPQLCEIISHGAFLLLLFAENKITFDNLDVLYSIVSYHIASLRIASHQIASHRTALYCIVSYCTVSYRIVSYHIISYRIVSYRIVSYHIVKTKVLT